MHHSFRRVHKTLRVTPAIEAGLAGRIRDFENLADLLSAKETAVIGTDANKRDPFPRVKTSD